MADALRLALLAVLVLAVVGCGEPEVDIDIGERQAGQRVLDLAGVLEEREVEAALDEAADRGGLDVVALAFADERASLGQADRGGRALLEAWDADVVLVAVALPNSFAETDPDMRRRYFGVYATDRFTVTRGLREEIVDEVVPGPAGENDWTRAFVEAARTLGDALEDEVEGAGG